MNYIPGCSREQSLLFPEVVDDYIEADNPVRFIEVFVEGLNLAGLDFKHAELAETGRPPYAPGDLLKLYIYGYLNRIRSSRRLEGEAARNVEVMWLLRKLRPDFKTIADFRKDNLGAIKAACREFTLLCHKLELFGGELVAIDGSKFRAQNAKERNYSGQRLAALIAEIDAKVQGYLTTLETQDKEEASQWDGPVEPALFKEKLAQLRERGGTYRELLAQLEQSGEKQVSLTDPDSRAMSTGTGSSVGYNIQAAVDAKHKLIVETEVTNTTSDTSHLSMMAIKAQEILEAKNLRVVADKGYYNGKEILACDTIGITAYVAKPLTSANTAIGLFGKERFTYDKEKNLYRCPAGAELTYRFSTNEKKRPIHYYRASGCRACPLKNQCTRNAENRTITRLAFEELQEEMAIRVQAHPELMRARKGIIEHCFGTIKRSFGYDHFLLRGRKKVGVEVSLTAMAYNLKRAINIVGVKGLMEALG